MQFAVDQYITRVDKSPAMGDVIHLMEGVKDSSFLQRRPHLLTFLKGKKDEKEELKKSQPALWRHFEQVWKIREDHLVRSILPEKYFFMLKCCGKSDCAHPLCAKKDVSFNWFKEGPTIDDALPIPVLLEGPCPSKCESCVGHYERAVGLRQNRRPAHVASVL